MKNESAARSSRRAVQTEAVSREFDLTDCVEADEFYRRILSARPRAGAGFFEDRGGTAPGGRSTLVAVEPVLRLSANRGQLKACSLRHGGEMVLPLLRLPERPETNSRSLTDAERMEQPGILDGVRSMLEAVEDRRTCLEGEFPICALGAFGFDLFEPVQEVDDTAPSRELATLDVVLALDGVLFDHERARVIVTCRSVASEDPKEATVRMEELCELLRGRPSQRATQSTATRVPVLTQTGTFLEGVESLLEHISAGDVFQAVLSHREEFEARVEPSLVYRKLSETSPSRFHFFLDTIEGELFGTSPEPAVLVEAQQVELTPVAGTRPRGRDQLGALDQALDEELERELKNDPKELSEHTMLVDLARNDLARICVPGSRKVDGPPRVEKFSHVQHLVSTVRGTLRGNHDALVAYQACANMGTLTGAPKARATELIHQLEPCRRGFFGGAVGVLTKSGDLTTAIAIRCLLHSDGRYRLQAGAGIVAASTPEGELKEIQDKLTGAYSALVAAIEEGGSR